jgi:hypothetical protein
VSPANPAHDLSGRERVLKQEEALDRRLEARAAEQPVYVLPRFWRRPPMASHSPSPSRRQPNDTRP